jgi:signal transduction histidine kinase
MNMDQEYLKTLTVLYVEDDNDIREQFREFLLRLVGTLITATNGAEGLEAFVEHAPDIVITDILMPGIDGLTMACKIRGLVRTVPIIVLTAFEQTDYLKRAIDIGVDKYVSKPVNGGLLLEGLLDCCHWLRAGVQEEQLKQELERKIVSMRMKHNETVVTLAGGMAHDYNNLLQVIMGYISLVKTEIEPHSRCTDYLEKVDGFLTETYELGQRLIFLGDGSREESQYGPIMELVQEAIKAALTDFSVTMVLDTHEEDPFITFFESQICFVFSKLAVNALEAMSAGGTLYVSSKIVTIMDQLPLVPGTYLHITMSDNGSGISQENLLKIFDPYFSTKQRCSHKGMGLSLALCHTIIVKHGGIITAESTVGSGTTFNIWLPVAG